jgi:hypothetical protein
MVESPLLLNYLILQGFELALQAGGHRFKSCSAYHGDVVQCWLERRPVTPEVASSSLVVPARYIKGFRKLRDPFFLRVSNFQP